MFDPPAQSTLSRCSIAVAIFGGACHLLFVVLTLDPYDSWKDIRPDEWSTVILCIVLMSAPSLVLVVFLYVLPVVCIQSCFLFGLLHWRIEEPHQYHAHDNPAVMLVFFGEISAAVVVVWAGVKLVGVLWRMLKS